MRPIPVTKIADAESDRSLREIRDAMRHIQQAPSVSAVYIENVALEDGVVTTIAHGLGRRPKFITCSPIRESSTAGRIVEIRDSVNREKFIKLIAADYGQTIYVDVKVE